MAYQTGTATTQQDLLSQLFTFLTSNGWTQDEFDTVNNRGTIHNGTIYVSFRWNGSEGGGPDNIAVYQSLGFTPGNDAWNHPDDSGNGTTSVSLVSERRLNAIGNGPYTSYHFFVDSSPTNHFYMVLEYSPGRYRHMGAGLLDKIGDWTGGEYCGAHFWDQASGIDRPDSSLHSVLMEGAFSSSSNVNVSATLHIEDLPNQPGSGSGKWAVVGNISNNNAGNDRGGTARGVCVGGMRAGPLTSMYSVLSGSLLQGFVPLCPIAVFYEDQTVSPDDFFYLLGYMPNVRHLQLTNFNPAQEITIGPDTWIVFPGVRKRFESDDEEESWDLGIAYLKTT